MEVYSNRHKPILILGGFEHRLVKITRDGGRRLYRCLVKGCKGRANADIREGAIVNPVIVTDHNHPPDHAAVEIRKHRHALKEAARKSLESPKTLIMNQRSTASQEVVVNGPSFAADLRTISRLRAKNTNSSGNWLQDLLKNSGALDSTGETKGYSSAVVLPNVKDFSVETAESHADEPSVPIASYTEDPVAVVSAETDAFVNHSAEPLDCVVDKLTVSENVKIEQECQGKAVQSQSLDFNSNLRRRKSFESSTSTTVLDASKEPVLSVALEKDLVTFGNEDLRVDAVNEQRGVFPVYNIDHCESPGTSGQNEKTCEVSNSNFQPARALTLVPQPVVHCGKPSKVPCTDEIGHTLCSNRNLPEAEIRGLVKSLSVNMDGIDPVSLVKTTGKLCDMGLGDCAHMVAGVALRSYALDVEVNALKKEIAQLRQFLSTTPNFTRSQEFNYVANRVRRGMWYANVEGMVHIADLRLLVDELLEEQFFNKYIHPREAIHYVTRYILCRIIPPYNYKVFVLRKRGNEENVMMFPNSLVLQIANLHADACGIQLANISEIDVELETRLAVKDVLSDLRRASPKVNQLAVRRNKQDRDWHHDQEVPLAHSWHVGGDGIMNTDWRRLPDGNQMTVWQPVSGGTLNTCRSFDDGEHVDVD